MARQITGQDSTTPCICFILIHAHAAAVFILDDRSQSGTQNLDVFLSASDNTTTTMTYSVDDTMRVDTYPCAAFDNTNM